MKNKNEGKMERRIVKKKREWRIILKEKLKEGRKNRKKWLKEDETERCVKQRKQIWTERKDERKRKKSK